MWWVACLVFVFRVVVSVVCFFCSAFLCCHSPSCDPATALPGVLLFMSVSCVSVTCGAPSAWFLLLFLHFFVRFSRSCVAAWSLPGVHFCLSGLSGVSLTFCLDELLPPRKHSNGRISADHNEGTQAVDCDPCLHCNLFCNHRIGVASVSGSEIAAASTAIAADLGFGQSAARSAAEQSNQYTPRAAFSDKDTLALVGRLEDGDGRRSGPLRCN